MGFGAGLGWITIVGSYLVLSYAFRDAKRAPVRIVLGGFALRVAMLFGLLWLASRTLVVDLGELVLWAVSFYMLLVVAEAWELAAEARSTRGM
jgi:hypothetical protein